MTHHPPSPTLETSPLDATAGRAREAFERIDAATDAFARASGIHCPPGCGACCVSPHIEVSVTDVLPLALEFTRSGEGEALRDELRARGESGPCALYRADPEHEGRGSCSAYALRPALCRLYGFAARKDRAGRPELVACPVHVREDAERVAATREAVAAGALEAPLLASAGEVAALDPARAESLPINAALARALELVGLEHRLAASEGEGRLDDEPRRPSRGGRRSRRAA